MSARKVYNVVKVNPLLLLLSIFLGLLFVLMALRFLIRILWPVSIFILIAALLIRTKVVIGYGKWLIWKLRENTVIGVLGILATFALFPLVAIFLLVKAIESREIKEPKSLKKGEYISYEEVDEDFLDLSDLKDKKRNIDNEYGDLLK